VGATVTWYDGAWATLLPLAPAPGSAALLAAALVVLVVLVRR